MEQEGVARGSAWRPGGRAWIGATFFLMAFAPGLWFPVLSTVLKEGGINDFQYAFACVSGFTILSPLVVGSWADRHMNAEKLLGVLSISGAGFLWLAFHSIEAGWGSTPILVFISLNALVSGPMWSLLGSVAFAHSDGNPEKRFPFFRVWGTIGWLVAGLFVSFVLQSDSSPLGGKVAAFVRIGVAVLCFAFLPRTPPRGRPSRHWHDRLGLGALADLKGRDERVFLLTSFLLAIVLHAFLMCTPLHLQDLGVDRSTAKLTLGQLTEIPAILFLGVLAAKFSFRHLLLFAMACSLLRYSLFALAGYGFDASVANAEWLLLGGITLHGLCYTLFFITGQLFIERRCDEGTRSQGQAFYGLISFGLGSVFGSFLTGALHRNMVAEGQGGWGVFWAWHAVAVLALILLFAFGYRGKERTVEMRRASE